MKYFIRLLTILLLIFCSCCSEDNRFHAISKEIVKNEPDFYIFDPIAGLIHKSNATRNFVWPEHKDGKLTLKTNNLGFRRDTDTLPDKKGKIRILLTGDSNISGVINNSESCCNILESLLNKSYPNKSYEVINSAVGYYSPHNYLGVINKYLYLAPDVYIVIVYGGNDFIETCRLLGYKRSDSPDYYAKLEEVRAFNANGLGQGLNQIYYFKYFPESIETSLKAAIDDFHAIKEICDAHNIMLIVLLLPSKIEVEWSTDELRLNKCRDVLKLTDDDRQINLKLLNKMSAWLNNDKITNLNLYDYMKGKNRKMFWNEDYHLNDYGHQIIAETLFAKYKDVFFRIGKTESR